MKRLAFLFFVLAFSTIVVADIVVVTHKDNSIVSLDKKSLVDIYMGRTKTFENGIFARPIDQKQSSAMRKIFYEEITGKRLAQVNAYWARLKFTGRHQPPLDDFENTAAILRYVESTPGAIAYVDSSEAVANVKIVFSIEVKQ